MNMKRKLAGFSACALVLSSLTVPVAHAASVDLTDIDGHWAKSSIERWASYEVVQGFVNKQFKPEDTMTRAQMAQILANTLGLTATATTNPFTDVSDTDWFKDAILKCNAAGIMKGTSDTTANPNAEISRQDAVTMMGRALGIEADGDSTTFDDNGNIGKWAAGYVNAMFKRGIVKGRAEGVFAPTGEIKRCEIVTILDRAITTYVNTADTEVTASAKGITLIAAPGVTVKGEAEDILIAPAATGTTKLDGVKVSGAVTMQAADGTLVLGGKTTAAKLNIPALATGAKITIEKDATVAAMNSAADNVAIDGSGNLTELTVASGKGVTVAGSVKTGKIVNNSSDSVKKGNTTIAANATWNGTTSGGGGGSSSSGSGGGGGGSKITRLTAKNAKELKDQADNATGETEITMIGDADGKKLGNVAIVNKSTATGKLTINLQDWTADKLSIITSDQMSNITINGTLEDNLTNAVNQIGELTLNTPRADVTNNVYTGDVNIEAVKDDSYNPTKRHKKITMKGSGKLAIPDNTTFAVDKIVVATKDEGDKVVISGNVKAEVTVNSPALVILKDILNTVANALKLTSENENARIQVQSNNVQVSGTVKELDVAANTTVMLDKDADVATATTAPGANIAPAKDESGNIIAGGKVAKVEANGDVTVGVPVATLEQKSTTASTVKLENNVTVDSITTGANITVAGAGTVKSVDATAEIAVKKAENATVKVDQVAAIGDVNVGNVKTEGFGANEEPMKAQKQAAPTGVTGARSDIWGNPGTISKVTTAMEYAPVTEADVPAYTKITTDTIKNDAIEVAAGKYWVRFSEKADGTKVLLASEPVQVPVPAQVGVTDAEIQGAPYIGQTLTAEANVQAKEKADDVNMKYQWYVDGVAVEGNNKTFNVTKEGQRITVTISNYGDNYGDAQSATSPAVYTEKEAGSVDSARVALQKAIDAAKKAIADAATIGKKPDGTDPATVTKGEKFVTDADIAALNALITKAEGLKTSSDADDISAAISELEAATAALVQTGTKEETTPPVVTPTTFTITFNSDGGSEVDSLTFNKDAIVSVDTLPTPTREGYTFAGWFIGDTEYTGGAITGNITLTAKWTPNTPPPATDEYSIYSVTSDVTGLTLKFQVDGKDVTKAAENATVTIVAEGAEANTYTLSAKDSANNTVEISANNTFTMPKADVTVTASKVTPPPTDKATITFTIPDGVTVTANGKTLNKTTNTVEAPKTDALEFTIDAGSKTIESVKIGDTTVAQKEGVANTYTLTAAQVATNPTVVITLKADPKKLTLTTTAVTDKINANVEVTGATKQDDGTYTIDETAAKVSIKLTITDETAQSVLYTVDAGQEQSVDVVEGTDGAKTATIEVDVSKVTDTIAVVVTNVSADKMYTITNGSEALVALDKATAAKDATVTVTPVEGATVETVIVTDADSGSVNVTTGEGTWTFTMPAKNVTVTATGKVTMTLTVTGNTEGSTITVKQDSTAIDGTSNKYAVDPTKATTIELPVPADTTKDKITVKGLATDKTAEVTIDSTTPTNATVTLPANSVAAGAAVTITVGAATTTEYTVTGDVTAASGVKLAFTKDETSTPATKAGEGEDTGAGSGGAGGSTADANKFAAGDTVKVTATKEATATVDLSKVEITVTKDAVAKAGEGDTGTGTTPSTPEGGTTADNTVTVTPGTSSTADSKTWTFTMPEGNVTVTATVEAATGYTATLAEGTTGITLYKAAADGTETEITETTKLSANDKVVVKAADANKMLKAAPIVAFADQSATGKAPTATLNADGTATFDMPAANVTVSIDAANVVEALTVTFVNTDKVPVTIATKELTGDTVKVEKAASNQPDFEFTAALPTTDTENYIQVSAAPTAATTAGEGDAADTTVPVAKDGTKYTIAGTDMTGDITVTITKKALPKIASAPLVNHSNPGQEGDVETPVGVKVEATIAAAGADDNDAEYVITLTPDGKIPTHKAGEGAETGKESAPWVGFGINHDGITQYHSENGCVNLPLQNGTSAPTGAPLIKYNTTSCTDAAKGEAGQYWFDNVIENAASEKCGTLYMDISSLMTNGLYLNINWDGTVTENALVKVAAGADKAEAVTVQFKKDASTDLESGITVTDETGDINYNTNGVIVATGGTLKFKVTAPEGKTPTVKNGTTTLTADGSGVYSAEITKPETGDAVVTITVEEPATP